MPEIFVTAKGIEAAWKRAWYGIDPGLRRSRFHTQKGEFVLRAPREAVDLAGALVTGLASKVFRWRPVLPWITFPATRFLRARLTRDSRVFEWGAGMSTLWFDRRCVEVHAVEDDAAWFDVVRARAPKANIYLLGGSRYVEKIRDFPAGYFDLISVDGSHRLACFREALSHVGRGGVILVDNTDNDRTTGGELLVVDGLMRELGPGWRVHRFPGWGPCNFFSWETTVCVRT